MKLILHFTETAIKTVATKVCFKFKAIDTISTKL